MLSRRGFVTGSVGAGAALAMRDMPKAAAQADRRGSEQTSVAVEDIGGGVGSTHRGLGSVSMLRPDGSPAPGSPFNGGGSAWGALGLSSMAMIKCGFPTSEAVGRSRICAERETRPARPA